MNLIKKLMKGFSKLSRDERLQRLFEMNLIDKKDIQALDLSNSLTNEMAEHFIENVIGSFQLPLGVATNFVIDHKPFVIPMAVEETSIIAAASKTAKWINKHGRIETHIKGKNIIGQMQIAHVDNWKRLETVIDKQKIFFINQANDTVASGLVKRGGGVSDIQLRAVERGDGTKMAVLHIYANSCDAMGANIMNQICEYLKPFVEHHTQETVTMCILSNLVDSQLTCARVVLEGVSLDEAQKIEEASLFANCDPYRAATSNKGVLNGIDPILIATGNDWRAVEAGVHAYAVSDGQYRAITRWWVGENEELIGELKAPIVLGLVGGVTKLHPTAQMNLKILNVSTASELSRVCAAVGLVQNLGALRALTSEGIIEGHMKLHIKNLILNAGASKEEAPVLQRQLETQLKQTRRISLQNAIEVLQQMR